MSTPEGQIEEIRYPFVHSVLNVDQRREVDAHLSKLHERYGLFADRPEFHVVISVFISQCCPAEPSPRALRLVTHLLYMTLYLNDGRTRGLSVDVVAGYWAVARGRVTGSDHPLFRAASDFFEEFRVLEAEGERESSGFYHYLGANLGAFARDAAHRGTPSNEASFRAVRNHSISAMAYLQFWKVLAFPGPLELLCGAELFALEVDSAEIQALANDLCSVLRDQAEAAPNRVLMRVALGDGLMAARRALREEHDRLVERYSYVERELYSRFGHQGPVGAYVEFIGSCICGNYSSMELLTSRYRSE